LQVPFLPVYRKLSFTGMPHKTTMRFKKFTSDRFYDKFSFYCKFVNTIIKSERLRWLRCADEYLKSQATQSCRHVSEEGRGIM
jgi:hypothetical protein